mmetsp:Transcript_85561/g.169808  ORF Transcript_85561/g.169808 Transcript_85561/m.169808 type:complete len:941 (+) Transcript_85561:70-2892(+)
MARAAPFSFEDDLVPENISSVCIGTGRFLRAVLVPALSELGGQIVLAQTRGTSFVKYLENRPERTFEVDSVLQDGRVTTARFAVAACGSLGTAEGRAAFMQLPARLPHLRYIGLGLTEAGIVHNGVSIIDLAEFLHGCFSVNRGHAHPLSIINTDNLPFNGDAIKCHVRSCDFTQQLDQFQAFDSWLQQHVHFHNTMVDRITSHRDGAQEVPRAEPLPAKALVLEDAQSALPPQFGSLPGVIVRAEPHQLALDIAMKLRVANGLHTAMVYAMVLGGLFKTDSCITHPDILPYLEQLFERDIVHGCAELSIPRLSMTSVFSEWMARLQHPHFGLDCLFVCQNAMQKMGIRLWPSVKATLAVGEIPSDFMAFSLACILRFLTPIGEQPRLAEYPPVFVGQLDPSKSGEQGCDISRREYVPGLSVDVSVGTYEFRDGNGTVPLLLRPLGIHGGCSAVAAASIAGDVLSRLDGFNSHSTPEHKKLAAAVGSMLHRMLTGDAALSLLASLRPQQPLLLHARHFAEAVQQEVDAAEVIDMHTHLFSAEHGIPLVQFGIDAMLTYHYLVAEYLATCNETPEEFHSLPRSVQAERIWQGLFIAASPLSEHCRGVLTTLSALGLHKELAARDLNAIRKWYDGQGAETFNEKMMRLARVRYVVTSHDPFDAAETAVCLRPLPPAPRYRMALSVDKLLEGDWEAVISALDSTSLPQTLRGVMELLDRCVTALQPEFLVAATPHDFSYDDVAATTGEHLLDATISCKLPLTPQQVLDTVLLPLCHCKGLPLSLRMGTCRGINAELGLAGDGLGPAQLHSLAKLCRAQPRVKFMVTVLSRKDHHEAAVVASRFRNLHLWGCWWYCNNPSIVAETTTMRLEMLGSSFTFQASSARVHDQLIYKWIHARAQLTRLLVARYAELAASGWQVSRGDVRRDVKRLLGGAFEEFCAKKL